MTASAPKYIRLDLEEHVFNSWKLHKQQFGFGEKTHSEFAVVLLQRRLVTQYKLLFPCQNWANLILINSELHNIITFCL